MNRIERYLSFVCAWCCGADEVTIAHDHHAARTLCCIVIIGSERRAKRRRAEHLAVEHALQTNVGGVLMAPRHKRAAVYLREGLPCKRPFCRRGDGIFCGKILRQRLPAREFRVTKGAARSWVRDLRVLRNQSLRRDVPFFSGHPDQQVASRGRHAAELRRHRRRGPAAKRACVKRRQSRIGHDQPHAFKRHSQFVSDGLRNRRSNVLTHFGFAGKPGHHAVFPDVQPRCDFLRQLFVVERTRPRGRFLQCQRVFRHHKHRNAGSKNLEKLTPRQFELMHRSGTEFVTLRLGNELLSRGVHRPRSCILFAACRTASMMRGCVPQRQTLPCRN